MNKLKNTAHVQHIFYAEKYVILHKQVCIQIRTQSAEENKDTLVCIRWDVKGKKVLNSFQAPKKGFFNKVFSSYGVNLRIQD